MGPKKKQGKRKAQQEAAEPKEAKRVAHARGAKSAAALTAARMREVEAQDQAVLASAARVSLLESPDGMAWKKFGKAEILAWFRDFTPTAESSKLLALTKHEDIVVFAAECSADKEVNHDGSWDPPARSEMDKFMRVDQSGEEESGAEEDGDEGPSAPTRGSSGVEGPQTPVKGGLFAAQARMATPATVPRGRPAQAAVARPSAGEAVGFGCAHCELELPPGAGSQHTCAGCGMRIDLSADHFLNKARFEAHTKALFSAAASAPAAAGTQPTQTSHTSKAGVLEEACKKQREEAGWPDRAEFADGVAAIPYTEALARVRRAFLGSNYADPPAELLELVRCGKLRDVGLALPRTHDEMAVLKEKGNSLALLKSVIGGDSATPGDATLKGMCALRNLGDFTSALLSTVIPALVDKPAAVADWCTLARSVTMIERAKGWEVASKFLTNSLRDREAGSIGVFKPATLTDAEGSVRPAPRAGGAAPAASQAPRPAGAGRAKSVAPRAPPQAARSSSASSAAAASVVSAPPSRREDQRGAPQLPLLDSSPEVMRKDVCMSYSTRGDGTCSFGSTCRKLHSCCWIGCGETHSGRVCAKIKLKA